MMKFFCTSVTREGQLVEGLILAETVAEVREKLAARNQYVVDVRVATEDVETDHEGRRFSLWRAVSDHELALLAWQLHTMLSAGLQLLRSLKLLARQTPNAHLKSALTGVCLDVSRGTDFSVALERRRDVFPPLFASLVRTGEMAGNLDKTMKRLAEFLDRTCELRDKVVTAMTYPAVLMGLSLTVTAFLLTFVLPRLATVFSDAGVQMPALTLALLAVGSFLRAQWLSLLLVALGGWLTVAVARRTSAGRFVLDQFWLSLPLVGPILTKSVLARLCQSLATLQYSGVPITASLVAVERDVDNAVAASLVRSLQISVGNGEPLSVELGKSPMVPELVTTMVSVGEETGTLADMLERVSLIFIKEVDFSVGALSRLLEPLLLVLMTAIVGTIAASIYLPIADLATTIGK